jgi:uncharacterized membrane protein
MTRRRRIDPRRALIRVAIAIALGTGAGLATLRSHGLAVASLSGWVVAALTLLTLSWGTIGPADAVRTRTRAGSEDPGRTIVYVVVLGASTVSLLSATFLSGHARTVAPTEGPLLIGLCLATVALAWLVTNTAFTLRYAHLYYREDDEGVGGVDFPGHEPPTYFDFAYLAFTVGMCFQVSDVCVTSHQIRRTVLLHAVLSFVYNTTILAFVLNLVFAMVTAP